MTTASELAQRLEAARQASGLTRQQLTQQAGVSRQAVYRLFKGHDVQVSTLLAVAAVLQLDLATVPRALQRGLPELGLPHPATEDQRVKEPTPAWPLAPRGPLPARAPARTSAPATPPAQATPSAHVAAPATAPRHAVSAVQRRLNGLKQAAAAKGRG